MSNKRGLSNKSGDIDKKFRRKKYKINFKLLIKIFDEQIVYEILN